jgi:hypothetical protein
MTKTKKVKVEGSYRTLLANIQNEAKNTSNEIKPYCQTLNGAAVFTAFQLFPEMLEIAVWMI